MAYFNHAFHKTFLATEGIVAAGVHVSELKDTAGGYGPGFAGFFDAKTNESLDISIATCPFYIASAAIKINDKQGPFHGGYQESNKSKVVNPKYIRRAWMQTAGPASRAITEVGATPDQACTKEFYCGEDYNLRIEVKGTDALRFANHNLYQTLQANGGCCDDPSNPALVNPATIYLQWARQIVDDPYLKDFIRPIIIADGVSYAYDEATAVAEGIVVTNTFDLLEAAIVDETNPAVVGMVLLGAYAETKFGNCTFTPSDYYSVEPIQIYASEVDLNGDPCTFEGLCVNRTCEGIQAEGLGESVARDVILHESYLTNFFHADERIREITQGTDLWNVIDRDLRYDRVYLQHSVPRFNNPSGVFDNDQYILDVIVPEGDGAALVATLAGVLAEAGCEVPETIAHGDCDLTTPLA